MKDDKILQESIELSELILTKANHAFDQIRQEESMDTGNETKKRHKRTGRSKVAAAAAICLLAASGVSAAAAIQHYWGRGMNGNIQANESQQQQLAEDGIAEVYPEKENYEDLKVTCNGVTVAPHTVIVDERFAYLSFTISGYTPEEGKEPGFEDVAVDSDDVTLDMSGTMYDGIVCDENGSPVYDDGTSIEFAEDGEIVSHYLDENGNLEYIIQAHVSDENASVLGKTIHVDFKNLGTLYKTEYTNALDGSWAFDIKLQDVSSAKSFEVNQKIEGTDFTLTKAEVSPISMKVEYTTDQAPEIHEDSIGVPVVMGVVMKDGTRLPYLADGGSTGYKDDTQKEAYNMFGYDRVIDVDQVQSLIILPKDGADTVEVDIR